MVLLKQDKEKDGKMLLTKALKYAHNMLGNHQFVSQVSPALSVLHANCHMLRAQEAAQLWAIDLLQMHCIQGKGDALR